MQLREMIELVQQHHPNMQETEAKKAINRAIQNFARKTKIVMATDSTTTDGSTTSYALSTLCTGYDVVEIDRVELASKQIPRTINKLVVGASAYGSGKNVWWIDGEYFMLANDSSTTITPVSTDKSLCVWFTGVPRDLASLGDSPEFDSDFHDAPVNKVISEGYERKASLDMARHYYIKYRDSIKEAIMSRNRRHVGTSVIKPYDM